MINAIVYGEIAFAAHRIEVVSELLFAHLYDYRAIPREAAFLAARAHGDYRNRGSSRRSILPDFMIGAHALVKLLPLLTRDEPLNAPFSPRPAAAPAPAPHHPPSG